MRAPPPTGRVADDGETGGGSCSTQVVQIDWQVYFFPANGWSAAVQFLIETDAVYFKFDKNKRDPEIVPCVRSTREQGFLFIIFPCG